MTHERLRSEPKPWKGSTREKWKDREEQVEEYRAKLEEYVAMTNELRGEARSMRLNLQEYEARIKQMENRETELVRNFDQVEQRRIDLEKQVASLKKELEWEKVFRAGQQKLKDKIASENRQLQHDMMLCRDSLSVAQKNLENERRAVERERAQRLIDIHKLQLAMDGRKEAEERMRVAEESAREAKALEDEALKKLEPLETALNKYKDVEMIDKLQIGRMEREMEAFTKERDELEKKLEQKAKEAKLWKQKHGKLSILFGKLQKAFSQSARTNSEKTVLAQAMELYELQGVVDDEQEHEKGITFAQEEKYLPTARSMAPTFSSLSKSTCVSFECPSKPDSGGSNERISFAQLLQSAKEQVVALESDARSKAGRCNRNLEAENHQTELKKLVKTQAIPNPTHRSNYIGHGLGLKKHPGDQGFTPSLTSGSPKQILQRIILINRSRDDISTLERSKS